MLIKLNCNVCLCAYCALSRKKWNENDMKGVGRTKRANKSEHRYELFFPLMILLFLFNLLVFLFSVSVDLSWNNQINHFGWVEIELPMCMLISVAFLNRHKIQNVQKTEKPEKKTQKTKRSPLNPVVMENFAPKNRLFEFHSGISTIEFQQFNNLARIILMKEFKWISLASNEIWYTFSSLYICT